MKSETIDLLVAEIGEALRQTRLQRNLSQKIVAERSQVSFNTVSNVELGNGASLKSFLAICRTLGKTDWIKTLSPPLGISPIEMMKRINKPQRQRASVKGRRHG